MRVIESLAELSLQEDSFPIFFWDKWALVEKQLHNKQRLLCVDDEQNVVPFTIYRIKFFRKGEYLYTPLDKEGNRLSIEKEREFLESFHSFVEQEDLLDVLYPPSHFVVFYSIPSDCIFYKLGLLVVDLRMTKEELFEKLNKENRKQVRKAEEQCESTVGGNGSDCILNFYNQYKHSSERKGFMTNTISYFESLKSLLGQNAECSFVSCNGSIEASFFCIKDNKMIFSLYSGTSPKMQYKGSKKYLLWSVYLKAKTDGLLTYVSGGYRYNLQENDPLHNVHSFKLSMGADLQDGFHFIKIINPRKYHIVTFALRVKSLLTGRDCSFVNLKGLDVKKSK